MLMPGSLWQCSSEMRQAKESLQEKKWLGISIGFTCTFPAGHRCLSGSYWQAVEAMEWRRDLIWLCARISVVRAKISGQTPCKADWSHWAAAFPATALLQTMACAEGVWLAALSGETWCWRGRGSSGMSESCCLLATAFHIFLLMSGCKRLHKTFGICKWTNRWIIKNYQFKRKKKVKCLIFPGDICYGQISSSSSQVCSIKYITQSARIYKTYCNSNLPRQVVFNYPYRFQERNILNI